MFRPNDHCRPGWKSPDNERDLECTSASRAPCCWSNLTDTRAADGDTWRSLPGSDGPPAKKQTLTGEEYDGPVKLCHTVRSVLTFNSFGLGTLTPIDNDGGLPFGVQGIAAK